MQHLQPENENGTILAQAHEPNSCAASVPGADRAASVAGSSGGSVCPVDTSGGTLAPLAPSFHSVNHEEDEKDPIVSTCDRMQECISVQQRWKRESGAHLKGYALFRQVKGAWFIRTGVTIYPVCPQYPDLVLFRRDLQWNNKQEDVSREIYAAGIE